MKKRLGTILIIGSMIMSMVLSGCGGNTNVQETTSTSASVIAVEESKTIGAIEKPEKITVFVNSNVFTKVNGRDKFEEAWERITGIDMEIIQPDHDAYYDVLGQTLASGVGNWPDVFLMNMSDVPGYSAEGVLWDMTEAWENSDLKASGRLTSENVIESTCLDGKMYAFAHARGNGCVTYVKKAWLDNVKMEVPTNYDEYIKMLEVFTKGDPDANGVDGDTYAVSSAGLILSSPPYVNYLPEFYQEAYPSFYQKADGSWTDGFIEDSMKEALERLKMAYEAGYIDRESLTNGTSDVRNKFYEDKFGVFTYWAGTWGLNLKVALEANGHDGELIALPPITEVGEYWERQAPVWGITSSAKNPEGIFKYFIENMVDGGEMQTLWTYGVEDVHWSTNGGEFHMLESLEKPGTQYTKHHLDPMLTIFEYIDNADPGLAQIAKEAAVSQKIFNENSKIAPLAVSTEEMIQYNGDLTTLKASIVADIVTQGISVESGMARFESEGGATWSKAIVDSLNNK